MNKHNGSPRDSNQVRKRITTPYYRPIGCQPDISMLKERFLVRRKVLSKAFASVEDANGDSVRMPAKKFPKDVSAHLPWDIVGASRSACE